MTNANIIIITLQSLCVILNGVNAGIRFSNDEAGLGILYTVIALLWLSTIIIRVISL